MKMAKYTTEVRNICESKAGLEESKGFNNIDSILNDSWNKIFTTQCTFFDDNYRPVLCKKILKHYYTREIGLETVGLWMLHMNRKLEEIMPYYNQMYESELLEFNPLYTMDLHKSRSIMGTEAANESGAEAGTKNNTVNTTESDRQGGTTATSSSGTAQSSGSGTNNKTTEVDGTTNVDRALDKENTHKDAYSDTPQGSLNNVDTNAYLTNYRRITDDGDDREDIDTVVNEDTTESGSDSYTESGTTSNTETITHGKTDSKTIAEQAALTTNKTTQKATNLSTTENYVESVYGNNGSYNFSRLLQDFRDTFLNIDMMVIEEFKDLFMGLW